MYIIKTESYVLHIEVVLKQLYFVDTKQIQNIQGIGIFFSNLLPKH